MSQNDNRSAIPTNYQVYLLRLQREPETENWYISLQHAQENKQRVFADLNSLALYLGQQMSLLNES